jgi:3-methyl-2-oxobutanoate hydroxymethyltransferase
MKIRDFKSFKRAKRKITVLTCYDHETARIHNEAGVDVLLVGDTVGMVKLGYDSTIPVTVDDMILFTKAVKRGNTNAFIVADVPFIPKKKHNKAAVKDAKRIISEGGADAVKIEVFCGRSQSGKNALSPKDRVDSIKIIKDLVKSGINVMGHVGLTPQYIKEMGGYKVQGKDIETAQSLLETVKELENIGIFSIVLECIPASLAAEITDGLSIPTIGIGAGRECDGQVLVIDDILGLCSNLKPRFVKQYADVRKIILRAAKNYCADVRRRVFPGKKHSF